ncbi:MAG: DUF4252 domain-containing protein [Saprospiraceae bacterium]|nr:DUF4252 domain-containing protein [Saprospiraceae bacterium]
MKSVIWSLALCLLFIIPVNGQRKINRLFDQMKDDGYTFALTLPGWLVKTGLNAAHKHTLGEDKDIFLALKKHISGVRLLVDEKSNARKNEILKQFAADPEKSGMELYASFTEKNNLVKLFVEEKKDKIKNLLFIVSGENDTVLLHLKTDIAFNEFKNSNFSFNKKNH